MTTRVAVVIGSARQGRLGERVARLVVETATRIPVITPVVVDLRDHRMPFFDEPCAPFGARDRDPDPSVRRWLEAVSGVDGLLFLTPEYNHAPPAVLKNALDHLAREAELKPAAVVGYSETPRGGCIAAEMLKLGLSKLGMTPLPHSVAVPNADRLIAPDGSLRTDDPMADRFRRALERTLTQLASVAIALRDRPRVEVA